MNVQFARRMENVQPSAIRELLRLGADPSIISFGGGYPDASHLPAGAIECGLSKRPLPATGQISLQYTVSNGIPKLREQIAQRMGRDGITCTAEDVLDSCRAASRGLT